MNIIRPVLFACAAIAASFASAETAAKPPDYSKEMASPNDGRFRASALR